MSAKSSKAIASSVVVKAKAVESIEIYILTMSDDVAESLKIFTETLKSPVKTEPIDIDEIAIELGRISDSTRIKLLRSNNSAAETTKIINSYLPEKIASGETDEKLILALKALVEKTIIPEEPFSTVQELSDEYAIAWFYSRQESSAEVDMQTIIKLCFGFPQKRQELAKKIKELKNEAEDIKDLFEKAHIIFESDSNGQIEKLEKAAKVSYKHAHQLDSYGFCYPPQFNLVLEMKKILQNLKEARRILKKLDHTVLSGTETNLRTALENLQDEKRSQMISKKFEELMSKEFEHKMALTASFRKKVDYSEVSNMKARTQYRVAKARSNNY